MDEVGAARIEHLSTPSARGVPGLVQGVYGEVGNLELVVPGADGLWVYWFNADPVDHRREAPRWAIGAVDSTSPVVGCSTPLRDQPDDRGTEVP